jgi:hypothetical protein
MYGDSYCGIYCGACSILVLGETGKADGFIACCKSIPQNEMKCGGCKSDTVYGGCRTCSLRDCAKGRGVERCTDCFDFPCAAYQKWQTSSNLLPHVREAALNVEVIRKNGAEAWLDAERTKWRCPSCGGRSSWYAVACAECGKNLENTYRLNFVRKLICGVLLPKLYRKGAAK